jgi:hypothetical protein
MACHALITSFSNRWRLKAEEGNRLPSSIGHEQRTVVSRRKPSAEAVARRPGVKGDETVSNCG